MDADKPVVFRENHCRLSATICRRCGRDILAGDDAPMLSQIVKTIPAPVDHTNAVAALYLGHPVTEVTGSHAAGFRAGGGSYQPRDVDKLAFDRHKRNKQFLVWHDCHRQPRLAYQLAPPPEPEPDEFDLFNQPPVEPSPPY